MSQTVTGGRAQLYLPDQSGNLVLAGVFESVNYTKGLGVEDIHTLGAYAPREIAITSYNAVTLSCAGFRVIGKGTTVLGKFPRLADILSYQGVVIKVVDRQSGDTMLVATGCVPNSENGNHNARATSRMTINYMGIAIFDESTTDSSGNPTDGEGVPSWP